MSKYKVWLTPLGRIIAEGEILLRKQEFVNQILILMFKIYNKILEENKSEGTKT